MSEDILNSVCLAALVFGLGILPGTWLTRVCRLPQVFWLPMVFASASAIAYAEIWLFLAAPIEARTVTAVVLLASLVGAAAHLSDRRVRQWLAHRDAWLPGVLMLALSVAYLGYLLWSGSVSVTTRFEIPLALEDNLFPWWFADRLFYGALADGAGRIPPLTTMGLLVQTSDRPPLQSAVLLAVRSFSIGGPPGRLTLANYQIVGTICQMAWVAAFYALGRSIALSHRQIVFMLAAAACSGFFLLNSLYTWPKLFAAWLFLLALAAFVHVVRTPAANGWKVWTVIGGASSMALLAHGGPAYSLLALPLLLVRADVRAALSLRGLLVGTLTASVFLAPWMAYQRLVDPPGTMLIKAHLAGVWTPDDRGVLESIREAYGTITVDEYLHSRWENLKEQGIVPKVSGALPYVTQWQQFYHHGPALDALLIGLAGFLLSPRLRARATDAEADDGWLTMLTWYALGTFLLWMTLEFSPNSALIHHGSYAATGLLVTCAAAWLARFPSWAGMTVLTAHIALFIVCWLCAGTLQGGPPAAWSPLAGLTMVAGFAAFAAALALIPSNGVIVAGASVDTRR